MPAIQAMRSDALALRAKEDVQEKIPSFYNSVNQALGQSIMTGQDAAEQLLESRFQAANGIAAQLRQKINGQGGVAEMTAGAGLKVISSFLSTILMALSKTTTTDAIQIASDIANFMIERKTLQLSWDAAAATYAQWVVQAGYAGHDDGENFFKDNPPGPAPTSVTQTFTVQRWLRVAYNPADPPNNITNPTEPDVSFLSGRSYSSVAESSVPANLQEYMIAFDSNPDPTEETYVPTAAAVLFDATGPAAGPSNNNQPDNGDFDGDPLTAPTGSGDRSATVYQDPASKDYYILYQFEVQSTGAPGATFTPPNVSGTFNTTPYQVSAGPPAQNIDVIFSNATIGGSFTGDGTLTYTAPRRSPIQRAMGGRGALKYRDALLPRFTSRNYYKGSVLADYDTYYAWGSVGSISNIGHY